MIDQFGRNINYLRISVTDKCNLRCGYCIPPGQTGLLLPENILTNRQLLRLVSLFAEAGINRIRLTGGEPLLREDLPELIKSIKNIKGIDNVSVTTNGLLLHRRLPDLLHAGLDGINLSLDTLDARIFQRNRPPASAFFLTGAAGSCFPAGSLRLPSAALFFRVFLFSRSTGAASGGRLSGASPAVSVLLVLQAAEALFASGAAGAALASGAAGAAAAPPFLCLADDMPQGQNE